MPTTLRPVSFSADSTFIAGAAQRRRDAEHDAGDPGDHGDEGEDAPVERRHADRSARQQLLAPVADEDAERAAHRREQQALGQQLANQTPARRAERQPDRDLLLPRRRAREQQVGDVGADDQQHQRDDDAEDA